jgi:A/G-specific adenine glycosylase
VKLNSLQGSLNTTRNKDITRLRKTVVKWYKANGRTFPWRTTSDPFKLLVAEVMLRRTKADQVKIVYDKLTSCYPDARTLSRATHSEVENILWPLGLRWRIEPFFQMVKEICQKYAYKVPETRQKLKELPGVGDYVAGAVLSIGFGKKEWILDSNIVRLFKRYFGIQTSGESRRDKQMIELAKLYAHTTNPRCSSLAILDFTALVCTHNNPKHDQCPLREYCYANKTRNKQI